MNIRTVRGTVIDAYRDVRCGYCTYCEWRMRPPLVARDWSRASSGSTCTQSSAHIWTENDEWTEECARILGAFYLATNQIGFAHQRKNDTFTKLIYYHYYYCTWCSHAHKCLLHCALSMGVYNTRSINRPAHEPDGHSKLFCRERVIVKL